MYLYVRRRLTVAALIAIAGCGGAATAPPGQPYTPAGTATADNLLPQSIHGTYRATKSLVFVSDAHERSINVYETAKLSENPQPIAKIYPPGYAAPYGLAIDETGTLYVADNGNNAVELYKKGSTTLSSTITDGIGGPAGLAIDSSGTLYVSNQYPSASITEYAYHTNKPAKTITGGGMLYPFGLAIDKRGDVFIADDGANTIFKLPAGGSKVTKLHLSDLGSPIGIAIDPKTGYLWETSPKLYYHQINIYDLASGQSPIRTILVSGFPFAISIANTGRPLGEVVVSDLDQQAVLAFKPGQYTPYAKLTNDLNYPSGLLIAKP
jgi:DNA-binding beta-propeller fold protein YncE